MKPFHSSYITQICDFRSNYYIENLKHPPKVICPSMRFKYHGEKSKNGAQAKAINFKNQNKKAITSISWNIFQQLWACFHFTWNCTPKYGRCCPIFLLEVFMWYFHVPMSGPTHPNRIPHLVHLALTLMPLTSISHFILAIPFARHFHQPAFAATFWA